MKIRKVYKEPLFSIYRTYNIIGGATSDVTTYVSASKAEEYKDGGDLPIDLGGFTVS